ncbi:MAG: diguanylate cyclase [Acidimicrobiales bacterium]
MDDSAAARRVIGRALASAGYRVIEAADGHAALEVCRTDRPDLVLLEVDLPVLDGNATLREIRADTDLCSVPVLFLHAIADGELIARVDTILRAKATEDAFGGLVRETNEVPSIDILTGIGNRRRMETRILELAATHGPNAIATVVIVDIDDFGAIKDSFGDAVGDIVLRIAAGRLRGAVVDERVLVCRWADQQFLAAGVGLDATDAYALAEQARQAISATPFAVKADQTLPVTISTGCASGAFGAYASILEAANGALHDAKRRGRNRIVVASIGQPMSVSRIELPGHPI